MAAGSGKLVVEFSGDDNKLLKSLNTLERSVDKLTGALAQSGKKGQDAGAKTKKGMDDAGRAAKTAGDKVGDAGKKTKTAFDSKNLTGFATALTGIGSVAAGIYATVRLMARELEQVQQRQATARGAQVTLNVARQAMIKNIGDVPAATITDTITAMAAMSKKTGVAERFLTSAMAESLSATGTNIPLSTAAVAQAARFLREKPEDIPEFAGALADMAKVSGASDMAVNLGLLVKAGSLSRVVKPQQQALNIPRGLVNMRQFGATTPGAVALFGTISEASADVRGAMSATAGVALTRQLRDFFLDEQTARQRIEALQADPRLAKAFLEGGVERGGKAWPGASFEQLARGPIEALLLDPTSKAAQAYKTKLGLLPGLEGLRRFGQEQLDKRLVDPLERNVRLGNIYANWADRLGTTDIQGARGAIHREGLIKVLKAAGLGALGERIVKARYEVGTGVGTRRADEIAVQILEERIGALEFGRMKFRGLVLPGDPGGFEHEGPTARDREVVVLLRELVTEIRAVRNATERTARKTPNGGVVRPGSTPSAPLTGGEE